jgi:hypothetical protein
MNHALALLQQSLDQSRVIVAQGIDRDPSEEEG